MWSSWKAGQREDEKTGRSEGGKKENKKTGRCEDEKARRRKDVNKRRCCCE
jgi:hypothetical protein